MISISGVENKEAFFDALIRFFAPIEIELTVWGTIPKRTLKELTEYHIPCPWIRKRLFNEKRWQLSPESIEKIRKIIPYVITKLNIRQIVVENIRNQDTDEFEQMIMKVSGENLAAIEVFGGLLGMLAGLTIKALKLL